MHVSVKIKVQGFREENYSTILKINFQGLRTENYPTKIKNNIYRLT